MLGISILCLVLNGAIAQEVVDRILAVVDDEIILESEVLQFAQSLALQDRQDPMKYFQNPEIKSQILTELIDQKVLLAWAEEDTAIVVEDREIKRELESRLNILIEQVGSEQELEKLYGMSMHEIRRDFESSIRDGLLVEKLKQKKLTGLKVSRSEVEDFYEQHEKQLSDRPETIKLAHILLKIAPSPEAESRARELSDSLYAVLLAGGEFEELASDFSQDQGTAKRGGLLGWSVRGDFVPEFEEAAFSLEPGEFSPPVKSRFGFHIIRLNERQGEKISASHILIKLTPTPEDRERTLTLADSLYELLKGGADFAEIAGQYSEDEDSRDEGGQIGDFSMQELIPLYAKVVKKLEPGEITEPMKSDLGVQILKLMDRHKQRPLTLENDWESISQMTLNMKREVEFLEWMKKLKEDVYIEFKGL